MDSPLVLRLFVSSPGDVPVERERADYRSMRGMNRSMLALHQSNAGADEQALANQDEAIQVFRKSFSEQPGNGGVHSLLSNAYWGRAMTLNEMGRGKEAFAAWSSAIETDNRQILALLSGMRSLTEAHSLKQRPALPAGVSSLARAIFPVGGS